MLNFSKLASSVHYTQGYVILLKRLDEEANGLKRLRIQASHLLFDVSDATEIEERQHTGIEHRSCMRSRACTNVTGIFPPSVTSRRYWSRFSIGHCSRVNASTRAGSARFGVRLVMPYTRGSRTLERMFDASAHAQDLPHAVPVARQEATPVRWRQ